MHYSSLLYAAIQFVIARFGPGFPWVSRLGFAVIGAGFVLDAFRQWLGDAPLNVLSQVGFMTLMLAYYIPAGPTWK